MKPQFSDRVTWACIACEEIDSDAKIHTSARQVISSRVVGCLEIAWICMSLTRAARTSREG